MMPFFAAYAASVRFHGETPFLSWMRLTNNIFTGEDFEMRLKIWLENTKYIEDHNSIYGNFKLAPNKYSHLAASEYKALLGSAPIRAKAATSISHGSYEDSVDWRAKGVVNQIKDQSEKCGSCWAFSAIQAQESQFAKVSGHLYSLSESNLVDCASSCMGCELGFPICAYDYVIENQSGMFELESDYPYVPKQEKCKFDRGKGITKIIGYIFSVEGNETDLAAKVAEFGPASIIIDSSSKSFQLYDSGIYYEKKCDPENADHAVGCIGFGSELGVDYWIIRNSWGTDWGEKGYMRLARNRNNNCGVASFAVIPIASQNI